MCTPGKTEDRMWCAQWLGNRMFGDDRGIDTHWQCSDEGKHLVANDLFVAGGVKGVDQWIAVPNQRTSKFEQGFGLVAALHGD